MVKTLLALVADCVQGLDAVAAAAFIARSFKVVVTYRSKSEKRRLRMIWAYCIMRGT